MSELLTMSGVAWQRKQVLAELKSDLANAEGFCCRDFRLTVAQSGRPAHAMQLGKY